MPAARRLNPGIWLGALWWILPYDQQTTGVLLIGPVSISTALRKRIGSSLNNKIRALLTILSEPVYLWILIPTWLILNQVGCSRRMMSVNATFKVSSPTARIIMQLIVMTLPVELIRFLK